jgi:hypothetical protein
MPTSSGDLTIEINKEAGLLVVWVSGRVLWRGTLSDWLWAISHPWVVGQGAANVDA